MSFKFVVGQRVEYKPLGERAARLYKIVSRMPKEENALDLRYRIKSDAEAYERNVLECQLSADIAAESEYPTTGPRRSRIPHRTFQNS